MNKTRTAVINKPVLPLFFVVAAVFAISIAVNVAVTYGN